MKRKSFELAYCSIARSLDIVGDWWSLLILRDAFEGVTRFSDFQQNLGIAKNILTVRLKTLVERDILEVAPASDGSAYQEYVLTARGKRFFPVMVALRQWGEENCFAPDAPSITSLVDRQTGQTIPKLEVRSQDGRLLSFEDTQVLGKDKILEETKS